jgi:hypothetical protein
MRRPVMYLAGLLLATGASLVLAGPAQAAVSHDGHAAAVANGPGGDDYDLDYDYDYRSTNYDLDYRLNQEDNDNFTQVSLLNLLSPNGERNQGLGILTGGIS